ncbi:MAG: arginine--tRNA ligase [Actinomycetota bacterium]|nr:arginine--tRNA ligase [Actinomycetota bacterium]
MIRATLTQAVHATLVALGVDPVPDTVEVRRPAQPDHGDWSTNAALVTAKQERRPPRDLAAAIAGHLASNLPDHVTSVEVAGPGFVNFHLDDGWLHDVLTEVVGAGFESYARHDVAAGGRVVVEFVSANPTGPIHVGNGWWCAYGDALARVLTRCGWQVHREYYVNDTGGQIRQLGESLLARRRGDDVPEQGYQGAYVADLAATYTGADDVVGAGRWAADRILDDIRLTLDAIDIHFDEWFSQASIEESEAVADTVAILAEKGVVYDKDDATWLRSSDFGDQRDRVLVKSNGDYTYLAGDLAYHRDKLVRRGFDRAIDIFGADHHGQVASLFAGIEALGIAPDRLEIRLGQMISLSDGRMSKRSGNFVPLAELVAEIGADATRLLTLMSSIDQATTIDLEAVRRQSMDNPVYYVQYAHARIASVSRVAAERGVVRRPLAEVDLALLGDERELDVLRSLAELPDVVLAACQTRAPHKVTTWVLELAGRFHGFYHDCSILGPAGTDVVDHDLTQARLWLVEATRVGLAVALGLLGVSAPESM